MTNQHLTHEPLRDAGAYLDLQRAHTAIALVPIVWLAVFTVFVAGAALHFGEMPTPFSPGPLYAGAISAMYAPSVLLLLATLVAVPSLLVFSFVLAVKKIPFLITGIWARLYLAGLTLYFMIVAFNFLNLMSWYID